MPAIRVIARASTGASGDSLLTDLVLGPDGTLYATTRLDGALTAWSTAGSGLALRQSVDHSGTPFAGDPAGIGLVPLAAGPALLTGGAGGTLALRPLPATGTIGAAQGLGDPDGIAAPLTDMEAVTLATGTRVVYGGLAGADGIGLLALTPAGAVAWSRTIPDTGGVHADDIAGLAVVRTGGASYLVTAGRDDPGVTAWRIEPNGIPVAVDGLGTADGLWIAAPTALESVTVGGRSFLILAAAGSGSLSVMEISAGGALTLTDHVIDDLDSRFAGVSAIAVVQHSGNAYVISGGSDDGISVHMLLPDGRLLALADLADSVGATLANVTAIAARSAADGIDLFVASGSEAGLTRLRLDLGPAGAHRVAAGAGGTLTGTAGADLIEGRGGADLIWGGSGDDVILDGAGVDALSGGSGADIFVLAPDGVADTVSDFEQGVDRLDLSAWPMLRNLAQLSPLLTAEGTLVLRYGAETLTLRPAAGTSFDLARLAGTDLIGATHLPPVAETGHPAPEPDPVPVTGTIGGGGDDRLTGTAGADTIAGRGGDDLISGLGGNDLLRGEGGADTVWAGTGDDLAEGGDGDDTLFGGDGADRLDGGTGADALQGDGGRDGIGGGVGDDTLSGGGGRDRLDGGSGADQASGGTGRDRLFGGTEDDRLFGESGNDTARGGDGADMLRGAGGADRLSGGAGGDDIDGGGGKDRLLGQAGADRLAGGGGRDVLGGGGDDDVIDGGGGGDTGKGQAGSDALSGGGGGDRLFGGRGADLLSGDAGDDRLYGGAGSDRISGGTGRDLLTGGASADVFIFAAEGGSDRIADFQAGDRILLDDGLWSGTLSADRVIARFADVAQGDLVLDFGGGDVLVIEEFTRKAALAGMLDLF